MMVERLPFSRLIQKFGVLAMRYFHCYLATGSLLEIMWGCFMSVSTVLLSPEKCYNLCEAFYRNRFSLQSDGVATFYKHTSETFMISWIIARYMQFGVVHTSFTPVPLSQFAHGYLPSLVLFTCYFFFNSKPWYLWNHILKHRVNESYTY